jgi:hypothetical protein
MGISGGATAMKLPPDVEFHKDIRLLIYRPRGVLNEQSVNKIVGIIKDPRIQVAGAFQSIL